MDAIDLIFGRMQRHQTQSHQCADCQSLGFFFLGLAAGIVSMCVVWWLAVGRNPLVPDQVQAGHSQGQVHAPATETVAEAPAMPTAVMMDEVPEVAEDLDGMI